MTVAFVAPCPACSALAAWREEEHRPDSTASPYIEITCRTCDTEET